MALSTAAFAIERVAFEHHLTALGIGDTSPRISWAFDGQPHDIQNWTQSSYTLEISRNSHSDPEVFVIESSESSLVPWPADPLGSGESAQVRVKSTGGNGDSEASTAWSDAFNLETGLLDEAAWEGAVFVAAEEEKYHQNTSRQPILFRKDFKAPDKVASARLYITAHGLFTAEINGKTVGDEVLAPGWQSYHHRLQYSTFDVTEHIRKGNNAIGVRTGEGWYTGKIGYSQGRDGWGDKIELLALLVITDKKGKKTFVKSDGSWESGYGAIQASEIYDGEIYDFTKGQKGWSSPGFKAPSESKWAKVTETDSSLEVLSAPDGPPVRRTEEVELKEVLTTPSGKTVLDFGQNFAGWVKLKVKGPKGTNITMVHVEVLQDDEIDIIPLRTAKQTDTIILSGEGVETWEPSFTFHGFRYVQVEGWPKSTKLDAKSVTGVAINSDMRELGSFKSSSDILNKLHENVRWSMRSNFVSVPTDCPQRDERLGWLGDAHSFVSTANFLYDTSGFWKAWMKDVCFEQVDGGGVPPVVVPSPPGMLSQFNMPTAIWQDAVVAIPWQVWTDTGDSELLKTQYKCSKSWVDGGVKRSDTGLWDRSTFQYGDWLDPAAPPDNAAAALTAPHLVADAYLVHVTALLAQLAAALKLDDEAEHYTSWASDITSEFQKAWINDDGTVTNETQTGLVLPLQFSLFSDKEQVKAAGKRLKALVEKNDYKIGTGFAGTHLIGHALTGQGLSDTFYKMLFQEESPSWLYQVKMGGTTTWERWDSMLPNGTVNTGAMTSFNHYSAGSVASWIHGKIGGLEATEPGWKRFKVEVIPGGGLESAETVYYSPYGKVSTSWKLDGGDFTLEVEVPPNSVAEVILPGDRKESKVVGSGKYKFEVSGL